MGDRLYKLEESLNKLSTMILEDREASTSKHLESSSQRSRGRDKMEVVVDKYVEERPLFEAKPAKLEFPKFSGEDPTI